MINRRIHASGRFAKRLAAFFTCIAVALSLSACSAVFPIRETAENDGIVSLPRPDHLIPEAPVGDSRAGEIYRAAIYSIAGDETTLSPSTRVMWLEGPDSLERRLAEEALRTPTLAQGSAIAPRGSAVSYIETGMRVSTLSILPGGTMDSDRSFAHLASAMASTLLELDSIDSVNVLLSGKAMEYMSLPIGAITRENASLEKLMNDMAEDSARLSAAPDDEWRLIRNVTLYYPSSDGNFIVPETRSLQFTSPDYACAILSALSTQPKGAGLNALPSLAPSSPEDACIYKNENGKRILEVRLPQNAFNIPETGNVRQWQLIASAALSISTFCPNIDGVRFSLDGSILTEIEDADGSILTFENGVIGRCDFAGRIAAVVPVYYENSSGLLEPEMRACPLSDAQSIRARLSMLFSVPETFGLYRTVPAFLDSSAILGTHLADGIANVNLSGEVYRHCQQMSPQEEALFLYSMVNTLSTIHGVHGVRFYIEGRSVQTLGSAIHLEGVILPNYSLIAD